METLLTVSNLWMRVREMARLQGEQDEFLQEFEKRYKKIHRSLKQELKPETILPLHTQLTPGAQRIFEELIQWVNEQMPGSFADAD